MGDIVRYAEDSNKRRTQHTATLLLNNTTKGRQVFYKRGGGLNDGYHVKWESKMIIDNPKFGRAQGFSGDKSAFYRYSPPPQPENK